MLAVARSAKAAELAAGVDLMVAAVEWAAMHEPVAGDEAAWFVQGEFLPISWLMVSSAILGTPNQDVWWSRSGTTC